MPKLVREVRAARAGPSLLGYPNALEFRADSGFPEPYPNFPKPERADVYYRVSLFYRSLKSRVENIRMELRFAPDFLCFPNNSQRFEIIGNRSFQSDLFSFWQKQAEQVVIRWLSTCY